MSISAYAALAAKSGLEPYKYEPKPLGPFDVEIAITHCGLCHSDIHLINNDWGLSKYPLVPGHEIVGTVASSGPMVTGFSKGDRVAVGWQCGSCLLCDQCTTGYENLCADSQATCVGHHGGFAEAIRLDSRFVHRLPDDMDSESAAPLLCAGITVYSPLKHFNIRPSMRVGVIGVGGLGHLALQYASAFGCEVTAFSSSPDKEEEARILGANRYIISTDSRQVEAAASSLDFIICTITTDMDPLPLLNALRPKGILCYVGVPPSPLTVHPFALIGGLKSITGSPIGGRATMREMLDFSARHGIKALTEVVPMKQVNEAIQKVMANKARYRMVLTN
jgi:uncharacterized zinc-type alcohol dehydrogenase-like protein